VDDYNAFVGSVDTRVIPTLRKFEESGAKGKEAIVELKPVEGGQRRLASAPESDASKPA
jgi:hypothetical protein